MAIAFILEGIAIFLMLQFRSDPFLLVVLSGLVFFGWGEIFSLFPSTRRDVRGPAVPAIPIPLTREFLALMLSREAGRCH